MLASPCRSHRISPNILYISMHMSMHMPIHMSTHTSMPRPVVLFFMPDSSSFPFMPRPVVPLFLCHNRSVVCVNGNVADKSHNHIGHNYTGHDYIGHNFLMPTVMWQTRAVDILHGPISPSPLLPLKTSRATAYMRVRMRLIAADDRSAVENMRT